LLFIKVEVADFKTYSSGHAKLRRLVTKSKKKVLPGLK